MSERASHSRWAAYVLSELDESERVLVEQELESSAEARETVAGLRKTAALLGLAFEALPAPELSARHRQAVADASRQSGRDTAPATAGARVGLAADQPAWRRLAFAGMTAGALGVAAVALMAAQWPSGERGANLVMTAGLPAASAAQPPSGPPEMRLELTTETTNTPASFAISPDGRAIAYVAMPQPFASSQLTGEAELMIRRIDDVTARPLAKGHLTELPFWSPDGRSIGFFADGKLKRVNVAGGSVVVLADAPRPRGGTWGADGTILFAPTASGPIMRISAAGGTPTHVTTVRTPGQNGHGAPHFVDGDRFLFHASGDDRTGGVYLGTFGSTGVRRLLDAEAAHVHQATGQLLYVRKGTLLAQRFDPIRAEVTGDVRTVAERLVVEGASGAAAVSTSGAGPIVYRTWPSNAPGVVEGSSVALSPDGRWIAYQANTSGRSDIWIGPIMWSPDGRRIVFPSGPHPVSPEGGRQPIWRADGSELFFVDRDGKAMSVKIRPDGKGMQVDTPEPVFPAGPGGGILFARDGRYVAFAHRPLVVLLNWKR